MASKFLKSNFKSMNITEEEKNAYAKAAALQAANTMRKDMAASVSDKEVKAIAKSITDISISKKGNASKMAELLKKQLEEEKNDNKK